MGPFNASCSTCGGTVEAQQGSVFALCLPGEVVRSQHLRSSISTLDNLLQHLVRLKMSLREVLLLLNQVFYRCSHFSVCFCSPQLKKETKWKTSLHRINGEYFISRLSRNPFPFDLFWFKRVCSVSLCRSYIRFSPCTTPKRQTWPVSSRSSWMTDEPPSAIKGRRGPLGKKKKNNNAPMAYLFKI